MRKKATARRWTRRRARAAFRIVSREFVAARPGERFQARYRRRLRNPRGLHHRIAILSAGAALIVAGLILLPAPGPGTLVIVLGAATVAEESLLVAKLLDLSEVRLRRLLSVFSRAWHTSPLAVRAAWLVAAIGCLAGLGIAAFHLLHEK